MLKLREIDLYSYGYVSNLCTGDLNNDGKDELIITCEDGSLLVFSLYGDVELLAQEKFNYTISRATVEFLKKDRPYLLVAGQDCYLRVYEFQDGKLKFIAEKEFETRINSISSGDVFFDANCEIIVCSDRYLTIAGLERDSIQVLAKTRFNGELYCANSEKFKNHHHCSIIVGCRDNNLHLIQYESTFFLQKHVEFPTGYYITFCSLGDITGNGSGNEIVATGADNTLWVISYEGKILEDMGIQNFSRHVKGLCLSDIDLDGKAEIILLLDNTLEIYKFNNHVFTKILSHEFPMDVKNLVCSTLGNRTQPYVILADHNKHVYIYTHVAGTEGES